jgi:hypothetical protein
MADMSAVKTAALENPEQIYLDQGHSAVLCYGSSKLSEFSLGLGTKLKSLKFNGSPDNLKLIDDIIYDGSTGYSLNLRDVK